MKNSQKKCEKRRFVKCALAGNEAEATQKAKEFYVVEEQVFVKEEIQGV